ncbi:MAG: kinase [Bacilli bacterium]|nr:kinase [Bacilli bacterium]
MNRYNRVLIKLSGGAIAGNTEFGVQAAIVIGGGNIFRGKMADNWGIERAEADNIGTGQPYVTTDYPAVQRAIEVRCDAILAAKQGTSGVYNADPNHYPNAAMYRTLHYDDVIQQNLKVMDQSAFILARDYNLPIHVFNFEEKGTMKQICSVEDIRTKIHSSVRLEFV